MFSKFLAAFVLLAALILCAPIAVMAQEADTRVDLDPFIAEVLPYLLALLSAVATAALAWITKKIHDWTGIRVEATHRDAFQSALVNAARTMLARHAPTGVGIDVKSAPFAEGVEFVLRSVPDAVKYFNLSATDIERHLTPKLVALLGGK